MSVRIMTKVWDAAFPTMAMKLVALKLADCANDDGENVYPYVHSIEEATGASESAVREAVADMEASGLLAVTGSMKDEKRVGRIRPIRAFDVDKLEALHRKRPTVTWVRVEVPVHDVKTGEAKLNADGSAKVRPAWRLVPKVPDEVQPMDPPGSSQRTSGGPAETAMRSSQWTPPGPATGPPSAENPSIEPVTHPSLAPAGVCASGGSLVDELLREGRNLHVVEHLIRPLWGVLTFGPGQEPASLLRAIRDDLAEFADAALADGATDIRRGRSQWPSIAKAREAVQAAQARHMVRIEPGTTAWAAWVEHWHRTGAGFLARTYAAQGHAMVARQFPPIEPKREGAAA